MDADGGLSPPDVELDEYGVPVEPPPARTIRVFLVAACCLVCASVPLLTALGYIGQHWHLQLGPRLEDMAAGLIGIVPWFLIRWLGLRDRHGIAWFLFAIAIGVGSIAAVMLLMSGLFGSVCHRDCGGGY